MDGTSPEVRSDGGRTVDPSTFDGGWVSLLALRGPAFVLGDEDAGQAILFDGGTSIFVRRRNFPE